MSEIQLNEETPEAGARNPRRRRQTPLWIILCVAILLAALYGIGYFPRLDLQRRAAAQTETGEKQKRLPVVTVASAQTAPSTLELTLPGTIQAVAETAIYSRADGYIKQRVVDLGDQVRAGQLLAEIESPELDEQIREAEASVQRYRALATQAEANRAQVEAHLKLAAVTARRWEELVAKGVLSKQEGDEKTAAWEARKADLSAAEAAVDSARQGLAASEAGRQRLLELQGFRQVRAPFAGVITARGVDTGTLVSAGSGSAARELFRLAQIDHLRVIVNVPQSEASMIRTGSSAVIELAEFPGREFKGKVARTANTLDPASRTLLTEVQAANPGRLLLPGMHAIVRFSLRRDQPALMIPSAALRTTSAGPVVGIVGAESAVHFQRVTPGRDFGAQVEILDGLKPGQKVVMTLSDRISEGTKVQAVAAKKGAAEKKGAKK